MGSSAIDSAREAERVLAHSPDSKEIWPKTASSVQALLRAHGHISYGFRLLYVIAAVGPIVLPMMSIALFARQVFHPHYTTAPRPWGLSPLEDQTLAWGLMGTLVG